MLKKMTAIGLALGLVLPGASVLAQTAQDRAETQERTEKQEMLQKGSPAAGEQEREQERTRSREETQTREAAGRAKQQKQGGKDATLSGDRFAIGTGTAIGTGSMFLLEAAARRGAANDEPGAGRMRCSPSFRSFFTRAQDDGSTDRSTEGGTTQARGTLRDRHLTYFVKVVEQAGEKLHSSEMIMWLDRLEMELDNIRAALAWGLESNIESMLRLAGALAKFWHTRGYTLEGLNWLEQGLAAARVTEANPPFLSNRSLIRGKALIAYLTLLTRLPDVEKARICYDESLSLFQALGPEGREGMAWTLLLGAISDLTDEDEVIPSLEKSLAIFYETGDKLGISECLYQLAYQAEFEKDHEKATALVEQHLALRKEIGDQDGIGAALLKLAIYTFLWKNDFEQAVTFFEESLHCFRSIGKKSGVSWVLANYGDVCLWSGDHARAARYFEEGRRLAQDVGEKLLYAWNSFGLGNTTWLHGDYAGAIPIIRNSMTIFNEVWQRQGVVWIVHVLGDIALAQADEQSAAQLYEDEILRRSP